MTYWGKRVYFCTCGINTIHENTYWRLDGLYSEDGHSRLDVALTQVVEDSDIKWDAIDNVGRTYKIKDNPSAITLVSQKEFEKCFILVDEE